MWHKHQWKAVASHKATGGEYLTTAERNIVTAVLYQCDVCDRFKVKCLAGHWESKELGVENTQGRRGRKPLLQ